MVHIFKNVPLSYLLDLIVLNTFLQNIYYNNDIELQLEHFPTFYGGTFQLPYLGDWHTRTF